MLNDNKATINIVYNSVHHDHTKHVEVYQYVMKEKMDSRQNCIPYVSLVRQLANILIKGLPNLVFHQILDKLRMQDIFAPT